MPDRTTAESRHPILALSIIPTAGIAVLTYVACLVDEHTIRVVTARRLFPRWDLATHLGHGWADYHLLATGRIPELLWDLWLQGYWPPALSIYQIPFYFMLGGGIASGLRSALIAFVLAGLTGCVVLWRQWKASALLPGSVFLALLMSSPYLLAYASVTMTEMLGALVQLVVLLTYANYREKPSSSTARLFAVSLTVLFFTKYNYFFLLIAPLAIYECFDRTSRWTGRDRVTWFRAWGRRAMSSPTVLLLALFTCGLFIIVRTGGFDFRLLGQRISVHTIGNGGHVVLYLLLARLWYQHRRGRIDWNRLTSADPRVRPLLIWFVVPVTIWLASPYPNHIRDFSNLVINRPLGDSTVGAGVDTYLEAIRTAYFYREWLLAFAVVAFIAAAARYRRQPPLLQWIILAIPLQFAAIAVHQTRFPRFLLLTVVLLCLVASSEVGHWFGTSKRGRVAAGLLVVPVLAFGVWAARHTVTEQRFLSVAFENYTDNQTLRAAVDSIRAELMPDDRLAIVGQGNELSPGLFRWELGPPSGVACFPFEIGGARGADLALATRVLLLVPLGSDSGPLDLTSYYLAQRRAVLDSADRGDLALRREIPVENMHVALRLYGRTSRSQPTVACQ